MREIKQIVIHHSAGTVNTTLSAIRKMHIQRGFSTIGYHQYIYMKEGKWVIERGRPDQQIGSHAKGFNKNSLGICIAGNYEKSEVPTEALDLLVEKIADWCLQYKIPTKEIYGHREVGTTATACPGHNLFKLIGTIKERVDNVLVKASFQSGATVNQ